MNFERVQQKYSLSIYITISAILFLLVFNLLKLQESKQDDVLSELQSIKLNQLFPTTPFDNDALVDALLDDDKMLDVYTGNLLLGMNQAAKDFLSVNEVIYKEILQDNKDQKLFKSLAIRLSSPVGTFNQQNNVINFYNKWEVPVQDQTDFWVTNFPSNPVIALNSQLIPWPKCPEGTSPLIASKEAYRIGSQFYGQLIIKEYQKLASWQVTFDGVDLFDKNVIQNQRALLLISCKK